MMDPIKQRIHAQFSKASATYDSFATVQNKTCLQSILLLKQYEKSFESIGDLACGTGNSTQYLIHALKYQHCFGLDSSEPLIHIAKEKIPHSNVYFIHSDFDLLTFQPASFDLIFCNLGLQWSSHLSQTLEQIYNSLKVNGFLVFSIPLHGTFPELRTDYKNTFYSDVQILNLINPHPFQLIDCHQENYTQSFNTHRDAIYSLKNVGANAITRLTTKHLGLLTPQKIKLFFNHHSEPQLTYHLGIFIFQKEQ